MGAGGVAIAVSQRLSQSARVAHDVLVPGRVQEVTLVYDEGRLVLVSMHLHGILAAAAAKLFHRGASDHAPVHVLVPAQAALAHDQRPVSREVSDEVDLPWLIDDLAVP